VHLQCPVGTCPRRQENAGEKRAYSIEFAVGRQVYDVGVTCTGYEGRLGGILAGECFRPEERSNILGFVVGIAQEWEAFALALCHDEQTVPARFALLQDKRQHAGAGKVEERVIITKIPIPICERGEGDIVQDTMRNDSKYGRFQMSL